MRVDHIGIVVSDAQAAARVFEEAFGATRNEIVPQPGAQIKVIFMTMANCDIELIEPIGSEHATSEWLAIHGPGFHHLAVEVADLEEEAARLTAAGYTSAEARPQRGARGGEILFLNSEAFCGLLAQLVEPGT